MKDGRTIYLPCQNRYRIQRDYALIGMVKSVYECRSLSRKNMFTFIEIDGVKKVWMFRKHKHPNRYSFMLFDVDSKKQEISSIVKSKDYIDVMKGIVHSKSNTVLVKQMSLKESYRKGLNALIIHRKKNQDVPISGYFSVFFLNTIEMNHKILNKSWVNTHNKQVISV